MNQNRRKEIQNNLNKLEEIKSNFESLRYEEQDYLDNMPDSLKDGDKGSIAETNINALDDAINNCDAAIDAAQQALEG